MNGQAIVPFKERVNTFRGALEALKPQLAAALPKHMTADRMMRIVMTTVQRTPAILECSQVSVFGCIVQAAQLGLEPDGILGQAYLIPYGKTCTLIPGYKGLIKLARNSGELATIYAKIVHANDAFKYAYGLSDVLEHVPCLDGDPGDPTHGYAVARLKDGSVQFDVMSVVEIEKIRQRSKAGNSGPWVTDWEEMAKKTVLRRLCKMLPASVELARAVALDEAVDANLPQQFETALDAPEAPEATHANGTSGKLRRRSTTWPGRRLSRPLPPPRSPRSPPTHRRRQSASPPSDRPRRVKPPSRPASPRAAPVSTCPTDRASILTTRTPWLELR